MSLQGKAVPENNLSSIGRTAKALIMKNGGLRKKD